jgi:hypothetical protein
LAEAGREAIPVPLASPALFGAAKDIAIQRTDEAFPGQFQKQLMQSFGLRTDQAPSDEQRIYSLAADFNRAQNPPILPSAEFYSGDYQPLIHALQTGNLTDAKEQMNSVLKVKTPDQVFEHLSRWPLFPFTGQGRREAAFEQTLNPEEKATYDKAVQNKITVARQAVQLLHEADPNAPALSDQEFDRLMRVSQADKAATLERQDMTEQAKAEISRILALPPADRGPEIAKIEAQPELAAAVSRQFKAQTNDLSVVERHIESLPAENGARARFILQEALAIPPGPKRAAYLQNLQAKKVLTDEVQDQISELLSARSGANTNPAR